MWDKLVSNKPLLVAVLTLTVYAIRKVLPKLPPLVVPWVAVVLGVAVDALAKSGIDVDGLVTGSLAGLSASGLHETVGKGMRAMKGKFGKGE